MQNFLGFHFIKWNMYIDDLIQSILVCFQYEFRTVLLLPIYTLTIYYCFAGSNFSVNAFIIGTYTEWWICSLYVTGCLSKLHMRYKMSRIDITNPIKAHTIGNNRLSYTIVCVTFRDIRIPRKFSWVGRLRTPMLPNAVEKMWNMQSVFE